MASYLIRRVLLFVPTIIGATFVVFMLMALAPISIIDAVLPPGAQMQPSQREAYVAYLEERYGIDDPAVVQYLRWLNNISPVGLQTWRADDPEVKKVRAARRAWREEVEPQIREQIRQEYPRIESERVANLVRGRLEELEAEQSFAPLPGDFRFDRLPIKWPALGDSIVLARPVWPIIRERLPVSLLLNALAIPSSFAIAVLTGIWSARHRGSWQDWGTGGILLALSSIPVIWVGVLAIGFLANVQYFRIFPAAGLHSIEAETMAFLPSFGPGGEFQRGYLLDALWHLTLPVICLSYASYAYYSKLTRSSLLETLSADFVRTARAKGLSSRVVLFRHAFRNSLIPLITVLATIIPLMITGSIVVETIFSINGMGLLTIEALKSNDRELFLSVTTVILLLQLVCYLLADIAYVIADPRVSYEK